MCTGNSTWNCPAYQSLDFLLIFYELYPVSHRVSMSQGKISLDNKLSENPRNLIRPKKFFLVFRSFSLRFNKKYESVFFFITTHFKPIQGFRIRLLVDFLWDSKKSKRLECWVRRWSFFLFQLFIVCYNLHKNCYDCLEFIRFSCEKSWTIFRFYHFFLSIGPRNWSISYEKIVSCRRART